jgi:hypothetical protein
MYACGNVLLRLGKVQAEPYSWQLVEGVWRQTVLVNRRGGASLL